MTNMVVKIISKECIKPSSPTPQHLKIHKLSLLDQLIPSIYLPGILYYPIHPNTTPSVNFGDTCQRSEQLKLSLSETLTSFYPLAGRFRDNLSIDCNDEGVSYTEAEVESTCLFQFLNHPDVSLLSQFLPSGAGFSESEGPGAPLAMIQVTNFACGGYVVGVLVSHMVFDGTALRTFFKAWAARSRNTPASDICMPTFDAPSLFPQSDAFPQEATMMTFWRRFLRMGKCVTRRFVFDAAAIASLKDKAAANTTSSSSAQNPTRVEVVTALIWKCIMVALAFHNHEITDGGQKQQRPTMITHAVNLRQRAVPPFSENCMGNFMFQAAATVCSRKAEELELGSLVILIREAIKKLDGNIVESLQGDEGVTKLCELSKEMGYTFSSAASNGNLDYIGFTSWCNFGLYDVDFGWGKPIWMSSVGTHNAPESVFTNAVVLTDTRSRDGVEAWIYLGEQEMATLEQDENFLAFAATDHSPLEPGNHASDP
ncbi:stemmadenine O-acetyltransferase-like [Argentina anserina]|uniref:stemmadenine O-acetyltransferase-like n=1 Tax=Argentina anserina TaxID=57926 RepID=UPI0021764BBE|nr:stemmadenine O-acetyltransferase-like [Potentilla anserina]